MTRETAGDRDVNAEAGDYIEDDPAAWAAFVGAVRQYAEQFDNLAKHLGTPDAAAEVLAGAMLSYLADEHDVFVRSATLAAARTPGEPGLRTTELALAQAIADRDHELGRCPAALIDCAQYHREASFEEARALAAALFQPAEAGTCWFCKGTFPVDALIAGYDTLEESRLACLACNERMSGYWRPAEPYVGQAVEHTPHHGNHKGYACGFSGPHCWACGEPWPCRSAQPRQEAPSE